MLSQLSNLIGIMLSCKSFVGLLLIVVACNTVTGRIVENYYEERVTYFQNPLCKPSRLDRGIQCCDIGPTIEVQGGLYANYDLHYIPLASAYYVARYADALGYQSDCPTNLTFLRQLDIQTPWSGTRGGIAIDASCGNADLTRRKCAFPTSEYPFLCTGIGGTPGTYGKRLETLSYISILQGENLRWTLFVHCWRAKTPDNPDSVEIATSFNVFSLDRELCSDDRRRIIKELKKRGFNTRPENIIEFDYSTTDCS